MSYSIHTVIVDEGINTGPLRKLAIQFMWICIKFSLKTSVKRAPLWDQHYLNQWWITLQRARGTALQCKLRQNTKISNYENVLCNCRLNIAGHLRSRCVPKGVKCSYNTEIPMTCSQIKAFNSNYFAVDTAWHWYISNRWVSARKT